MREMVSFDYSALPTETEGKLRCCEREIVKASEAHKKSGFEMGRALSVGRSLLDSETTFGNWVERRFPFSRRTAYRYISVYEKFDGCANLAQYEESALYELATNERAKTKADKLAAKGEFITHAKAKELTSECNPKPPRIAAPPIEDAEFKVVESTESDSPKGAPAAPPKPVPPKPPVVEKDYGTCPNCAGTKWTTDDDGTACSKCLHPHGEPVGDRDEDDGPLKTQRSKTIKTAEALLRAFDDLHLMVVRPSEHAKAIACCKSLVKLAKEWQ